MTYESNEHTRETEPTQCVNIFEAKLAGFGQSGLISDPDIFSKILEWSQWSQRSNKYKLHLSEVRGV